MDENEPLDAAAARELQEETSVDPASVPLVQVSGGGGGWHVGGLLHLAGKEIGATGGRPGAGGGQAGAAAPQGRPWLGEREGQAQGRRSAGDEAGRRAGGDLVCRRLGGGHAVGAGWGGGGCSREAGG